jgi:hypothetical protein
MHYNSNGPDPQLCRLVNELDIEKHKRRQVEMQMQALRLTIRRLTQEVAAFRAGQQQPKPDADRRAC